MSNLRSLAIAAVTNPSREADDALRAADGSWTRETPEDNVWRCRVAPGYESFDKLTRAVKALQAERS